MARTPIEGYFESILRLTIRDNLDDLAAIFSLKCGDYDYWISTWKKSELLSDRAEIKIGSGTSLVSVGYSLDCPEEMFTLGEYRLRLRADMPIEGFESSSLLLWFKPSEGGWEGIANVLGIGSPDVELSSQRAQFQIAYEIGNHLRGGILLSARGERILDGDNQIFTHELSLSTKIPFATLSFDFHSGYGKNSKKDGWLEIRSDQIGIWRSDWNFEERNQVKMLNVKISSDGQVNASQQIAIDLNVKFTLNAMSQIEAIGQWTSNIANYENVKIQVDQILRDDGNNFLDMTISLPNDREIKLDFLYGFTIDEVDLELDIAIPFKNEKIGLKFSGVRDELGILEAEIGIYRNEHSIAIDTKFRSNENGKVILGGVTLKFQQPNYVLKLEGEFTKFHQEDGNWKLVGNLKQNSTGDNDEAHELKLFIENSDEFIFNITFGLVDSDQFIYQIFKAPKKIILKIPINFNQDLLHYEFQVDLEENIFFSLKRYDILPFYIVGNLTIALADIKQVSFNCETSLNFLRQFSFDAHYEFDKITYVLDQVIPDIEFSIEIKRNGQSLMVTNGQYLPDDFTIKGQVIVVEDFQVIINCIVGFEEEGKISVTVKTPYANVYFINERKGSWIAPDEFTIQLSAYGLDLISISECRWNFENFPAHYSMFVFGTVYSKLVEIDWNGKSEEADTEWLVHELSLKLVRHRSSWSLKHNDRSFELGYGKRQGVCKL